MDKGEVLDKMTEKANEPNIVKTYIITSAQAMGEGISRGLYRGAPNTNLLKGLEYYCRENSAELIILTMNGKDAREKELHPDLASRNDLSFPEGRSKKLNNNIYISDMVVPPQNVDPSSGRQRFVQTDQSQIYAHSKQRFKVVASSNNKLPKIMTTTGAVTHPNYNETNHRGDAARRDHTYGAVIVEIIDNNYYNLRHIKAQKDGKFMDFGMKFDGDSKPLQLKVDALVLGDIHVGDTDPSTRKANYEMIEIFKPKRLFLHDFVNGHSVNPYERKNLMTRAASYHQGRLSLEEELKECHKELCEIATAMENQEVNVVASNHDFFVDRYIQEGYFINEPWNTKLALKLANAMIDGENPSEVGIRMAGEIPKNVKFLKADDDYKVWGWQLASHGHKGISGSRGSVISREISHGKSITGHTHTPEILRNTIIVGTSTKLNLDYIKGSGSSWMAANALVYEGGFVQLIPIINGKWKKRVDVIRREY